MHVVAVASLGKLRKKFLWVAPSFYRSEAGRHGKRKSPGVLFDQETNTAWSGALGPTTSPQHHCCISLQVLYKVPEPSTMTPEIVIS